MTAQSPIDRPIIIIGTGRCGSTLLYRLLGYHPDVAWLSHYTSYLTHWIPSPASRLTTRALATLSRVRNLESLDGKLLRNEARWVPKPVENYRLLRIATKGVFTQPRPLTLEDLTPEASRSLQTMVTQHLKGQGKPRFLLKVTGFPRMEYLSGVFPDARFIHVKRDGRAVASSLCHVGWWKGEDSWGWGEMSEAYEKEYLASEKNELILGATYWKTLMDHFANVTPSMPPERLLEIRYDQLIANPTQAIERICNFAGLPFNGTIARRVGDHPITSNDQKWRTLLSETDQERLQESLEQALINHGFTP